MTGKGKKAQKLIRYAYLGCLGAGISFAMLWGAATNARADEDESDENYVDSEYVSPIENNVNSAEYSDWQYISDGCYYDTSEKMYMIAVEGYSGSAIESSVANHTFTQKSVDISYTSHLTYSLYRDGVLVSDYRGKSITEPGDYIVAVYDGNGNAVTPLSFTILGASSNVSKLTLPSGFRFTDVEYNGAMMNFENLLVNLTEEGDYKVSYECVNTGKVTKVDLNVDRTAPVLALAGVDEDQKARGPVDLSDLEEGAYIAISLDENAIPYKKTLTENGRYRVLVRDAAGNQSSYEFTILLYFNSNSTIFILMILAVIAAVIAYIVISRRRLRVR